MYIRILASRLMFKWLYYLIHDDVSIRNVCLCECLSEYPYTKGETGSLCIQRKSIVSIRREKVLLISFIVSHMENIIIEVWLREGVATLMDVRQNEILLTSSFFLSSHECAHFSTLTKGVSVLVLSRNISCVIT